MGSSESLVQLRDVMLETNDKLILRDKLISNLPSHFLNLLVKGDHFTMDSVAVLKPFSCLLELALCGFSSLFLLGKLSLKSPLSLDGISHHSLLQPLIELSSLNVQVE